MELDTLITRAGICRYLEGIWFKGAVLSGPRLAVADEAARRFVSNCWLEVFRAHIPDIVIVVKSEPERRKAEAAKPSIYNKRGLAWRAEQARLDGCDA